LNGDSECDIVTESGRLFHICVAATGKVQSTTVNSTIREQADVQRSSKKTLREKTSKKEFLDIAVTSSSSSAMYQVFN